MSKIKRILLSLLTIAAVGAVGFGVSQAFFSDTETSTGNVLTAGAIDLKVDNTCYYNGQACIDGTWGGDPQAESCSCTFESKDLGPGDVLFSFSDLKPGDWEEDTISLTVEDNDAWACVDIDVTENSDNGFSEPEDEVVLPNDDDNDGTPDGDLAEALNFLFWADDGDNVLETDEAEEGIITQGPASNVLNDVRWALADSQNNVLGLGGPLLGAQTYFVGKAFCYGEITLDPVAPGENSPTVDPGFDCDGSNVGNISQTDTLTGSVVFEAVQSRNNGSFLCNPVPTPSATPTSTPVPTPTATP